MFFKSFTAADAVTARTAVDRIVRIAGSKRSVTSPCFIARYPPIADFLRRSAGVHRNQSGGIALVLGSSGLQSSKVIAISIPVTVCLTGLFLLELKRAGRKK